MTETPGRIRQIAWREIFPWLILFRTFRIAISPPLLAIATLAVLIVPIGWWIGSRVFLTQQERDARAVVNDVVPGRDASQLASLVPPAGRAFFLPFTTALLDAYFDLAEPLKRFFQLDISLGEAAYYAFGFLWTLAIWAFPGGLITRRAVVQLATDDLSPARSAAIYAGKRYLNYFLAPLYPLAVLLALAGLIAVLGWVCWVLNWLLPGLGTLLAGVGWLVVVLIGLGALLLVGGLIFGWPLMWPTVSAERDGDPFEAFARSYSYVYGKPLYYFFYVIVAAAFGALSWAVVSSAAMIVQEFGFWALSWGAWPGDPQVAEIRRQALDFAAGEWTPHEHGRMWTAGVTLIGLFVGLVQAVASAFRFTFFFAVASAIYLLLRQDMDEKEMDEVYLEDDVALEAQRTAPAQQASQITADIPRPPAAAGEQP